MIQRDKLFIRESGFEKENSIIFLHGVCASSNMWLGHMRSLTNFHCVAPDFPGHGQSNQCQWTNIDEVTDWIANIIKTKCHGKAHVVGLSLGGAVGLNLLNKYPALIDKAIIDGCSAKPLRGIGFILFGIALIAPFIRTNAVIKFIAGMYGMKTSDADDHFVKDWKSVRPKSFRRALSDANRISLPDNVSHIKSRVLFVSGAKEPRITHRTHQTYSFLITGSKCLYYPEKNHGWLSDDPETHINMCQYWFENGDIPEKLVSCDHQKLRMRKNLRE
jgi:pimeloyl-ACP methyl ester carboxylesterase